MGTEVGLGNKEDVTIQGLKTTIERMEHQCMLKDKQIAELEEKYQQLSNWYDEATKDERVDW